MSKPLSQSAYVIAYEAIRDKILNGELEAGTKLVEERLAEEIGVSRTPVRESIRRLEQEGLSKGKYVVCRPGRGVPLRFQVRMILEAQAVRTAATYMSEEDLELLAKYIHIGRTGTVEEIMAANKSFHELIVQASRNPVMIDIIDKMQSIIYLFRKAVVYQKRPFLIDEHEEIYLALKQRDADKAEQLMKDHLQADLDFSIHIL